MIKARSDKDKSFLLERAKEYIAGNWNSISAIDQKSIETLRKQAVEQVESGNLQDALQTLAKLRDEKTGIITVEIAAPDGITPVVVRDARKCKNPEVRESEAFEMLVINAHQAACDIADIEGKPQLKAALIEKAHEFIKRFAIENAGKSQGDISKAYKKEIKSLVEFMEQNGVKKAAGKLNDAKEFQNFKYPDNQNVATLSSINDKDGKPVVVMQAAVAMKGLTDEQKAEYEGMREAAWFKKMKPHQQKLVEKYAPVIMAQKHVIPTQLRAFIPGMRNAAQEITAISSSKDSFEVVHESYRSGTLAALVADKDSRQEMTNQNARQAQEWVGEGVVLHCNTLNSGPGVGRGTSADREIVKRTMQAAKEVEGVKETNTAFNAFRLMGSASNVSDTKKSLVDLANSLQIKSPTREEQKALKTIQINLTSGRVGRLFSGSVSKALEVLSDKMTPDVIDVLRTAIDLRKIISKADVFIRLGDAQNSSLEVSSGINLVTYKINKILDNPNSSGIDRDIQREVMLTKCASGKDRTGLAMHDQSAKAVSSALGIPIGNVDKALLVSGHTTSVPGSPVFGGGSIGNYGTKHENKAGLPKNRPELIIIVEKSADSNKIKPPSRFALLKAKMASLFSHSESAKVSVTDLDVSEKVVVATSAVRDSVVTASSQDIPIKSFVDLGPSPNSAPSPRSGERVGKDANTNSISA